MFANHTSNMVFIIVLLVLCAVCQHVTSCNATMMTGSCNSTHPMLPDQAIRQKSATLTMGEAAAGGLIPTTITVLLIVILRVLHVRLQRRRRQQNTIVNDVITAFDGLGAIALSNQPPNDSNIRTESTDATCHSRNPAP